MAVVAVGDCDYHGEKVAEAPVWAQWGRVRVPRDIAHGVGLTAAWGMAGDGEAPLRQAQGERGNDRALWVRGPSR